MYDLRREDPAHADQSGGFQLVNLQKRSFTCQEEQLIAGVIFVASESSQRRDRAENECLLVGT